MTLPVERTRAVLSMADAATALIPFVIRGRRRKRKTVTVPIELLSATLRALRHYPMPSEMDRTAAAMPDLYADANPARRDMRSRMAIAVAERDAGMEQALDHAEREVVSWGDVAYLFLCRYAGNHQRFISEDVSDASKAWGMVQPPTDRAWGSVYRRACRAGVIAQDGVGRSRRRHASICPQWASLVYRRAA